MNGEQNQAPHSAGRPQETDGADVPRQEQPVAPVPAADGGFFRNEDGAAMRPASPVGQSALLEWTASDRSARPKPSGWLGMIIGGAVVAAILVYLLTEDVFSAGAIIVAAILFVVFSSHKPPELRYRLDGGGITIGHKWYPYTHFRSFSVDDDLAVHTITLVPLKRFMPTLVLNFNPEIESSVIEVLADRLPMEAHRRDAMDAMINKLRF